jgi:hypothetical protein
MNNAGYVVGPTGRVVRGDNRGHRADRRWSAGGGYLPVRGAAGRSILALAALDGRAVRPVCASGCGGQSVSSRSDSFVRAVTFVRPPDLGQPFGSRRKARLIDGQVELPLVRAWNIRPRTRCRKSVDAGMKLDPCPFRRRSLVNAWRIGPGARRWSGNC